jgi:outer membrane protein insertion porin family
VDRETKTTSIVHSVDEDELLYVREIKITGNDITKDAIVRRQLTLTPGDRFDGAAMRTSQRTLENTGYFEGTPRLTLEDPTPDDIWTDLLVNVDEGKTGNFSFGAGYSTEERLGAFTEVSLKNFDIMNWPTFTGGGQQFGAKLNIGDVKSSYSISFMDPELFGYPLSGGFDIFSESYKHDDADYTEQNQGFQVRGIKMLSPFVGARLSLRYVDTEVTDLPTLGYPTLRMQQDLEITIATIAGLTRNTVDLYRDPGRGSKHDIEVQLAGFGGDNEFYKVKHDSTWYKSIDEDSNWVASFRTREGWVDEYGSSEIVPLQERFFAGGSTTVRGYGSRDIGPRERRFRFFGEDYPVGGDLMFVTNTELKYKVNELFRLYAFVDTGAVWETTSDFDLGDIKYGAGLGFGVDVPKLGPIRIDYGFPLNPDEDQDDGGRLHLATGFRF